MMGPEETAREDDPAESAVEQEPEGGLEKRPASQQDAAESSELEGAPRGDPTP
jgi:hypothetical protein